MAEGWRQKEQEGLAQGIGTAEETREALIVWRDMALDQANFGPAVLLTHTIWWMSAIMDKMEDEANGVQGG